MAGIDRSLNDARRDLRRAIKGAECGDEAARAKVLTIKAEIAELRSRGAVEGVAAQEGRTLDGKKAACARWHGKDCHCWETTSVLRVVDQ